MVPRHVLGQAGREPTWIRQCARIGMASEPSQCTGDAKPL